MKVLRKIMALHARYIRRALDSAALSEFYLNRIRELERRYPPLRGERIYSKVAADGRTLKDWFIEEAHAYLEGPSLASELRAGTNQGTAGAGTSPKIISLYTGAGGLDYGFEAAGFQTGVAVEFDANCCKTLRANRPWPVIERDIHAVPTDEMLEATGRKRGEIDLVIGGPPCQPFSKSGYWSTGDARRLEDPRAGTLEAYMRVVEEALPRAFLLENVQGLVFKNKDEGLRLLLDRIEQINKRTGSRYTPTRKVVSAVRYGVPQLRERVLIVACRDGTEFTFPDYTHRAPGDPESADFPFTTAWDAIADLKPPPGEKLRLKGKWADLLPSIPEGQNYLYHTDRGEGLPLFGWRRRFWSFLLKLAKELPSWTIQAQPGPAVGPFHWENRRLSMRELCRLQTFPDDVEILGNLGSVQKQVGNAVPSLVGEVMGRAIRAQLLGLPALEERLRLLPAHREDVPSPEPVARVPKKYRSLIGDHSPHPGTGKGNAAIARAQVEIQS
jgi:DNA (cytosine-5)-methyltransferase 1